jgi:hypothetical protein
VRGSVGARRSWMPGLEGLWTRTGLWGVAFSASAFTNRRV